MSGCTEGLMTLGSFDLDLDRGAPRAIVEELSTWSTICVTPARLDGLDRDAVYSLARFSGRLQRRSDDLCHLEGPSILAWLGDDEGKGPWINTALDGAALGAHDLIDNLFNSGGSAYYRVNGLTLGTNNLPATAIWAAVDTSIPVKVTRPWLDEICNFLGWYYRCDADRSFHISDSTDIFTTTPTMLVVPSWWHDTPTDPTLRIVAGEISAVNSNDHYVSDLMIYGGTYEGQAGVAYGTEPYAIGHEGVDQGIIWHNVQNDTNFGSTAAADAAADKEMLANWSTENLIDISVRLDDPKVHVIPGDSIYVCDPRQGLVLPGLYQVQALGQVLFPILVNVQEMTWPWVEGMGVYAVDNATAEVFDLSDFALWGNGDTNLKVGARFPSPAEAVNGRN